MPQIWLTDGELAALLNCNPLDARMAAIESRLDRRKSRDGQTRTKLTPALTEVFLDGLLQHYLERRTDACVRDLRSMHARMSDYSNTKPDVPSRLAG